MSDDGAAIDPEPARGPDRPRVQDHTREPTVAPTVASDEAVRTRGFPQVEDLPVAGRLSVSVSAGFDAVLRTAGASVVAGSMVPNVMRRAERRRDRAALDRYSALADRPDRDEIFVPPDRPPHVEVVGRRSALNPWLPGAIELLRFPSAYVATDPGARVSYTRPRNSVAWAQHWRHEDGPRPTVVVVHGFMASPYWVNKYFFSLPWWYSNGYDLLLVTLPFHGRRARPWQYSGAGLFAGGPTRLIEGLLHAVHDIRAWIDHLGTLGVDKVGMTGVSLGGYLTALMAAVDERLYFAIPNSPVTDFVDQLDNWAPAGPLAEWAMSRDDIDRRAFRRAMRIHSPLHHQVLLDRDRLFIITGLGDRLAPPEHARQLWHHWGRPAVHAFPGNHLLHIDRGAYLRRIGRFIRSAGFVD